MIRAIVLDEKEKVNALCRAFPEMINEGDSLGISPLEMAVAHDNPDIVRILLEHGAQGKRAVQLACTDADTGADILELLLSRGFTVSTIQVIRIIIWLRSTTNIDRWLPKLEVIMRYPRQDLVRLQEAAASLRAIPAIRLLGGKVLRHFVKGKYRCQDGGFNPSYHYYSVRDIKRFIKELATREEFCGEQLLQIAGDKETEEIISDLMGKSPGNKKDHVST